MPFPLPEDLPNPGMELRSSALAGGFFTTAPPGKPSMDPWVTAARIFLSLQLSTQPVLCQGLRENKCCCCCGKRSSKRQENLNLGSEASEPTLRPAGWSHEWERSAPCSFFPSRDKDVGRDLPEKTPPRPSAPLAWIRLQLLFLLPEDGEPGPWVDIIPS